MAPWSYRLYQEFGNPVFPMLNGIFQSADYSTADHGSRHFRFIPDSLWEAFLRPLWMMSPESGVYTEPPSPDARYLSFFLLLALPAPFGLGKEGMSRVRAAKGRRDGNLLGHCLRLLAPILCHGHHGCLFQGTADISYRWLYF